MAGGKKGNTNALKHGLYAKQFNENQRQGLRRMKWDDFRHEEFLHRAIGEGIFKILQALLAKKTPDIDQVVKMVNALSINTTTTSTSARTHAMLNGRDEELGDALSEALDNVPFDEETDDKV